MIIEIVKFVIYSILIVIISKYILVRTLRKLAETLNLKAKTVGDIAGYATSVPEFLTITTSSIRGLNSASIYNILSSNVINLIQYIGTILINKNQKNLKNRAIIVDIILVSMTIIIPILLLKWKIELNIAIVPLFIIFYALFLYLNNNVHKMYLKSEKEEIEEENKQEKKENGKKDVIKYILYLALTGVLLYFIGELLGDNIEKLCYIFKIPEFVIGIILGFFTSIPELITFIEAQRHHNKEENNMLGIVEATNNLFTSNILNLFAIQTIGILITSIVK